MRLTLRSPWQFIDASTGEPAVRRIEPGEYNVDRVQNPFGFTDHPWIVIRGTTIGGPEKLWRDWTNSKDGEFHLSEPAPVTS